MNIIAVLAALGLEQWRALRWRAALERVFIRYARAIERKLNGGTLQHGVIATAAVILPPVLLSAGVFFALAELHPLLGLAWNIVVLYFLMGFRRFSHAYGDIQAALKSGDLAAARRGLGAWLTRDTSDLSSVDISKLAIERGLVDSYRHVFATLFWFTLLPGPAGAVLYRTAALLASEWRRSARTAGTRRALHPRAVFDRPAQWLLWLLDSVPVRLTALSFAIVGDFEDAAFCWRTQAKSWAEQEGGEHAGIVLASGAGALGVLLGGPLPIPGGDRDYRPELGLNEEPDADLLPSAVGLVWRALILWLLLMLLLTLANWAP